MRDIITYIDSIEDKINTIGANETAIEYAQIALGLRFNEEYIDLLKCYGCILLKGETIFGIAKNKAYDVVTNTIEEKRFYPDIPKDMYVVSSLGIEGILILQNADGLIFQFVPSYAPKLIFDSLLDYLKSL